MRIIMLDLDTLRPDHLGCYGYTRNTSPVIDEIAKEGVRFENYHCSDAPCLPSRAALLTGTFGIHNGAVGHGGTAGDLRNLGCGRDFKDERLEKSFFNIFRKAGYRTASISPFPERHSSYWFTAGLNEWINTGQDGFESAEEVMPSVRQWLKNNIDKDQWFLHINLWDAHTPYRVPQKYGEPFKDEPIPEWLTEDVFKLHQQHIGPHSLNELSMYDDWENPKRPRQPGSIKEYGALHRIFDGYDCGVRYMDDYIGEIVNILKSAGIYEDTAMIITADHGENLGELGIYSELATGDVITTRIPMIIKWPGINPKVLNGLYYNIDLLPTLADLLKVKKYDYWDGVSFYGSLLRASEAGRDYLVLSQCAHVCQRSVRFDHYIYIRTYHGGFHLFDKEMLFDLANDYYEQSNIAAQHPELCDKAYRMLGEWHDEMMSKGDSQIDPLWTVMKEGGPFHTRGCLEKYCHWLERTGRSDGARELRERYYEKA
ncbi:MAG: sulfatase [Clostridiales bacterium]|nr:sulfatase [Clostridiales bacterium]